MEANPMILEGAVPGKIRKPGRPKGSGRNLQILNKLKKPDSCIWGVSFNKMRSLITSARLQGMKLKVRSLEDKPVKQSTFAIWRIL